MVHKIIIKKKKSKETTGIYVTILAIIIFLIGVFTSYSSIKESEDLSKKLQEATKKKDDASAAFATSETDILLFSRLVGWRDESPWNTIKGGWTNQAKLRGTLNYWVKELNDKYKIGTYESWPEEAPDDKLLKEGKYLNLAKLINELEQIFKNNESKENTSKESRDSTLRKNLDVISEVPKVRDNKKNEIQNSRQTVGINEERIKGIIEQKENDVRSLVQEISSKTRELETSIKTAEQEFGDKTKELTEYQERLNKLKKKLRLAEEGIEVDGEIILADNNNGYVYLDLGRKDAIMEGMEFDVFKIQEDNLRMIKGKIKIIKIYDKYSEAAIVEEFTDSQNLIALGDLINCKTFSRSKVKSFAFSGNLIGKYTQDELKKKIIEFGGTTPPQVSPELTFLIVGEGYNKDPVFEEARQLGVAIIREKELYGLLGLEW